MNGERKMKRYAAIVIAALTILTVFSVVFASGSYGATPRANNVQTITKEIVFHSGDIKYVSGPTGHYIIGKGMRLLDIPGYPGVPMKNVQITLPKYAKVLSVKLTHGPYTTMGHMKISMMQAPVLKDGYKFPAKFTQHRTGITNSNAFFPQKDMTYTVGTTHDNTLVAVHLFPVKYNPAAQKVIYTTDMKITVTYEIQTVRAGSAPIDVPNIIITSPELKQQAQRLADFHNSTGTTSWVVTTSWIASHFQPAGNPPINGYGNNTTDPYGVLNNQSLPLIKSMIVGYNYTLARKIIAFLQNESNGNNVFYVTIFGNAREVPPSYYYVDQSFYIYAYYGLGDYYDAWIPTDAMYASPNYNNTSFDFMPTFAVGRLPVNNLTAKNVVDKIIHYANTKKNGIQNVTLSGGQVFETPYYLGETGVLEPMNFGWLDGTNITEYFHTLRNFTYNNFEKMMNNSDMIVEITHGSGFSFWHHNDEISAWDFPMNGSYGSLPIYVSGSCLNGAWDEEVYPSYEMSAGINGGTSIAEKMLYSPKGIIAYFGADREALGSTYAYFDNGTLIAPNDYGDLMTEDGTIAGYYIGTHYYGYATLGIMEYYAHVMYNQWVPMIDHVYLNQTDAAGDGLNDNPWARSYFEYSLLGDPALKVAGSGPNNPSYTQPQAIIKNAAYDGSGMPIITRGQPAIVSINTTSPKVKAELMYLEMDYGPGYGGATYGTYYDFVLNTTTLSPVSTYNGVNNFTYKFTPTREGIYILSIYGEDGKNTRFYMDCGMPTPPSIHLYLKDKKFTHIDYEKSRTEIRAPAPDVKVVTLLDYGSLEFGKTTNVTAVVYNNGNATATNVKVQFYLENYTLVFKSGNLNHPLVWLGNVTVNSIAPGAFAYVTLPWKSVNLLEINNSWDPYGSSYRWQYVVANAQVSGDSNPANNANWALLHVNLKLDVWAQKVFLEKDPVLNQSNNITFELTNVGTTDTSNSTVYVMDDYAYIAVIHNVTIAPGETKFFTVPWTPQNPGDDDLAVYVMTPGDNNTRNDWGYYYTNGYDSVTNFVVLTYDVAPVNASIELKNNTTEIGVQIYNYGPLTSNATSMDVYLYGGVSTTDIESPHPYPNNYDHIWEIDAPYGAQGMALHFSYLYVEPGYDYVYIYDQNMSMVDYYTGFHINLWTPFIHSSKLYVELKSDVYINYPGFKIDAIATSYVYAGSVNFAPLGSGQFETRTLNYSANTFAGIIGVKMVSHTPGEYATLATGAEYNNQHTSVLYVQDTATPEIKNYTPAGTVNTREPVISIEYYDKEYSGFSSIVIKVDGITIPDCRIATSGINSGVISAQVPFLLSDGEHTVSVTIVDNGGNSNSISWIFTVDATAPTLTITSPANGNVPITYDSTLWINGTTDPDANVTINGVSVPVDSNGNFAYKATLVEGQNVFVVEAKDSAGNVAKETVTALYMPELPELWDRINSLNSQIVHIQDEISSINTQISSIQAQLNNLSTQLNNLKAALDENVTALNNAIENTRTDLIHMINENITSINTQINNISAQVEKIKQEVGDIQDKNKAQDSSISMNSMIGYAGIALAILAIVIALGALIKKGNTGGAVAPESSTTEEAGTEEEAPEENEEEALEEI